MELIGLELNQTATKSALKEAINIKDELAQDRLKTDDTKKAEIDKMAKRMDNEFIFPKAKELDEITRELNEKKEQLSKLSKKDARTRRKYFSKREEYDPFLKSKHNL
jgi:hypothetical protein